MLSNEKWFGASAPFYDETIDQSLRFEDGDTARLNRTPSSASNRKTFTISTWIKRGNISSTDCIFGADNNTYADFFRFNTSDELEIAVGNNYQIGTNAVFRDTTNWYHIVLAFDVTESTSTDRVKIYVNGTQQSLKIIYNAYPANQDYAFNNTGEHIIGSLQPHFSGYEFDGYMAEFNFIDGTALDPTSFGETKNGVWIPKEISGLTYGTNGFRLTFADSSSIGDDTSGNTNDYTATGLASTDVMLDSPTNNFCTLNPLNANHNRGQATFFEGNLRIDSTGANRGFTTGTFKLTGKHYFEVYYKADNSGFIGINDIANDENSGNGQSIHVYDGSVRIDGSSIGSVTTFSVGDVIGVEVDIDAKTIEFFKNGVSVSDNTYTTDCEYFPYIYDSSGGRAMDLIANFGQDATFAGNKTSGSDDASDSNGQGVFYETPSSGFLALCSANESDTTLSPNQAEQADDYFNTVLYTGNATDDRQVTGVGFKPDWGWFKERDDTVNHLSFDSSRGATKQLIVNEDTSESTQANKQKTFEDYGYTVGTDGQVNGLNDLYVVFNWKANGGTTVSNTQGSITSTVQANTTAGFSIVTYTGTGSAGTIGHGLGKVPKWILIKNRDASLNWIVYHGENTSAPETDYLHINRNNGTQDSAIFFNDTAPTSSVISLGTGNNVNDSGNTYVAYVFAEIEGYSKFGTYIGNGNASGDGAYVYLGFRPQWLMIKRTDSTSGWVIWNNKVSTSNPTDDYLLANAVQVEQTGTNTQVVDFLSNGFKAVNTSTSNTINGSGTTHIYMAFAEQPFKFSNAR